MGWRLPAIVAAFLLLSPSNTVTAQFPSNAVTRSDTEHNRTTQGESGEACTPIGRHCLKGIPCENKRCDCQGSQIGNGQMECVDPENPLCLVTADPHLKGYGGALADVDLPCRYRLTRYVTQHRSAATQFALCSVEVYAINELHHGQYYVRGVQVSLGITDTGKQVHHQFEVKKFGVSEKQIYKFMANVSKVMTVWGTSNHEQIHGVDVFPTFDEDDNFAVLSVPECATRIKFRAVDISAPRQRLVPGISIMAPPDPSFVTDYGFYPSSLCGTHNDDSSLYKARQKELGLKNVHLAVIHDVLLQNAHQHHNPKKEECEAAMEAFGESTDRVADLNVCGSILTNAKTRKCIIKAKSTPIAIFTACLRFRKNGNSRICQQVSVVKDDCGDNWKGPSLSC